MRRALKIPQCFGSQVGVICIASYFCVRVSGHKLSLGSTWITGKSDQLQQRVQPDSSPTRQRRDVRPPDNDTTPLTLTDVRREISRHVSTLAADAFCRPPGQVCVKGPPGPRGPKGRGGKRGPKCKWGRKGAQGIMGPPGKHGKQGMLGPPGAEGPPGIKGDRGDPGTRGVPGIKGEAGESISVPMVMVSPDMKTVVQNQTASFQCSVQGNPLPEVTWQKVNGSVIRTGSNGALVIHNAQHQDSGRYRCAGRNILGQSHKDVQLVVEGEEIRVKGEREHACKSG